MAIEDARSVAPSRRIMFQSTLSVFSPQSGILRRSASASPPICVICVVLFMFYVLYVLYVLCVIYVYMCYMCYVLLMCYMCCVLYVLCVIYVVCICCVLCAICVVCYVLCVICVVCCVLCVICVVCYMLYTGDEVRHDGVQVFLLSYLIVGQIQLHQRSVLLDGFDEPLTLEVVHVCTA
jgi:hypothetical protein